jgi:hypothetical protein
MDLSKFVLMRDLEKLCATLCDAQSQLEVFLISS